MAVHEELPADAGQDAIDQLNSIRQSIDNIDAALIYLLAERFKFTQQVGRLKAAHGLPPADPARELKQIERLRGLAEDARLDPAFAEKFLNFIIAEVIHHHEKIAGGAPAAGPPTSSTPVPHAPVPHAPTPHAPTPHPPTPHAPVPHAPATGAQAPHPPVPHAPTPHPPTPHAPVPHAPTQHAPTSRAPVPHAPASGGGAVS